VHFLGILSYGDMRDNIFPFVGYGSMNYFVIAAKIDKDPPESLHHGTFTD
jgi:hypothetical protein